MSSASGGAPSVTLPALDASGVSAAGGVVWAETPHSACVFRRLLTAHGNAGASLPGTRPLRGARASGAHAGGDARAPGAHLRCVRPCRGRLVGKPRRAIFRFRQQDAPTPLSPCVGARGWRNLTGGDFWGSPGVPSPVSGIRTPRIPLLPVWEQGAGGMRGTRAQERRKPVVSPESAPLARG